MTTTLASKISKISIIGNGPRGGNFPWLVIAPILFAAFVATAWLGLAASQIAQEYVDHYGFFYDPAAYYVRSITAYNFLQEHGPIAALLNELRTNDRCPGRIVPYLLFAPKLLTSTQGHLWTELPVLWSFLALFAHTIYTRTRSLFFALAATSPFLGISFLYSGKLGVGTFWLDLTAALAVGCSALCLIRYFDEKQNSWMFGLGAFASLAVFCRWSAGCYLAILIALSLPAIIASSLPEWKSALRSLAVALLSGLPGSIFFFGFYESNVAYYRKVGYAFNASIFDSLNWTSEALRLIFGEPILTMLCWVTLVNFLLIGSLNGKARSFVALCFPVSVLIFVCFVAKAVDGFHPLVYFAPALFISSFCPIGEIRTHHLRWRAFGASLILLSLCTATRATQLFRYQANHPPAEYKLQKEADVALSKLILSTNAASFAQFDRESVTPHLEAFYGHGRLCKWNTTLFSVHEAYLKYLYPGQSEDDMARTAYGQLREKIALVAVFKNPDQALVVYPNSASGLLARSLSQLVAADSKWKYVAAVNSPKGTLTVYQNMTLLSRTQSASQEFENAINCD